VGDKKGKKRKIEGRTLAYQGGLTGLWKNWERQSALLDYEWKIGGEKKGQPRFLQKRQKDWLNKRGPNFDRAQLLWEENEGVHPARSQSARAHVDGARGVAPRKDGGRGGVRGVGAGGRHLGKHLG